MVATVVLITGANRGLGLALAGHYLLQPNHIVLAGLRTMSKSNSLEALPKDDSTALLLAQMDSATPVDAAASALAVLTAHSITHLDIVIANAGISILHPPAATASLDALRSHFEVNTLAPLALFQASRPLLECAASLDRIPRFVGMSSSAASIGGMDMRPVPNSVYGPSKAALNYLVRKMHFENDKLVSFVVDPGWVKTDMGNDAAVEFLGEGHVAETEIGDSVNGIVAIIEKATRKSTSGQFCFFQGGSYPW